MELTTDEEIGRRIQQRRFEKGYTIRVLADKAGLSPAFISQVERGKVKASLDSLRSISRALEVPMVYYFTKQRPGESLLAPPRTNEQIEEENEDEYTPIVRASGRPRLTLPYSDSVYELISNDVARKMEAFIARLGPNQSHKARKLRQPTEEIIFVFSGALQLEFNDKLHTLYPGDAIYFDGGLLQSMACASRDEEAVWLSVITPPMF